MTPRSSSAPSYFPNRFWALVAHFVRRMFASEDEQGNGSMSLGLGAVLAILASPGAFASLFLMDKYSTLLQWFRGQRGFDPYRASIADEYFFVVLSMTITGLIMVLRWNRLFPDRRDFFNLAVLPIPIRNIFLANFTALLGLALVFGVDVNAVSSVLFPFFVTISNGTLSAFLRIAISHTVTVLAASVFSFFAVFGLVGVLMLILPRRLFRPVSICIRIVLVGGLLTEFLSNLFLQLLIGRLPAHAGTYVRLLPSFWFLGIYERVAGLATPFMAQLGRRALAWLLGTILIAIAAYSLCYRRHFLRLAESLEIVGSSRRRSKLQLPEFIEKRLFRSGFEEGCFSFARNVLLRSERHLMFFGAYLGVGFVIVLQTALNGLSHDTGQRIPNSDLLAIPLLVSFFLISGLRYAFDIPAALQANWIFRISTEKPCPPPASIAKKLMLTVTLPWQVLILTPITASRYGSPIALEHVATVGAITFLSVEFLLMQSRKIPFTYNSQFETKQFLFRILAALGGVFVLVPMLSGLEHWMLVQPLRFSVLALLALPAGYILHRYRAAVLAEDQALAFEDQPASALELLKLA